ncbi:MAG: alanine--tRNA ligase [Cyanobacteriota bacterium]
MLTSNQIRDKYIDFFKGKDHKHLPSSSLIPHNDPSILLTTAGMLQFKPIMFGLEAATEKRVVTYQKCCRTTDLENVGRTPRHHTFFEMLGNFSFGDYYKREIISWAWDFITNELKLPLEKLNITVHHKDQEAYDIWNKEMGVPAERIVKLDDEDNFWAAGETGPCGFCSEIYYDTGIENGNGELDEKAGSESNRFLEFWNLVFMEFNRKEDGSLEQLPAKNIDTGMGLERITSILQNVKTNFDIDSFQTLIKEIETISGKKYSENEKNDTYFKIIADHIRAATYLICDGVRPGNVSREYVLRRIMRRAVRYGRLLEIDSSFLNKLVPIVIEQGKDYHPELKEREKEILKIVSIEEEAFNRTLNNGMKILNRSIENLKANNKNMIGGAEAFELYDTYGFPLELTVEIAEENSITVNTEEYQKEMEKQIERARAAHDSTSLNDTAVQMNLEGLAPTVFTGYKEYTSNSKVLVSSFNADKKELAFIVDKTPAYAESGGQISDGGLVTFNNKSFELKNIQKVGDFFVHVIDSEENILNKNDEVNISVNTSKRVRTARHHSVTHLLHQALKDVLGSHVKQAGSLVNESFSRFDFSHPTALTKEEISKIEVLVNEKILENLLVDTNVMDIEDAKKSGAVAMFGEKYGASVRVLSMGDYSKEFCGGTHVNRTGDIGSFRIITEEAISAGVRRVTSIAGLSAYEYAKEEETIINSLSTKFKVPSKEILQRIEKMQAQITDIEKENSNLKQQIALGQVKELINKVKEVNGVKFISEKVEVSDTKSLKAAADDLLNRLSSGVVVLSSIIDEKVNFVCNVSKDLTSKISAGNIIKKIAPLTGSKGGGKPDSAQAGGGTDFSKIEDALKEVESCF